MLAIWWHQIAKCTLAIWRQPIANHALAILATSYCLNRNDGVSSFYKTRGSKLYFLTCFSFFSLYFLILVFLQNRYSLIASRLSWLHGNTISCPVSCTFGTLSWYVVHAPSYVWHRMRGFLEARCFPAFAKVSGANVCWENTNDTFLTQKNPQTETFLRDISPAN